MTGYLRPGIQWKRNGANIMNDGSNYVIITATGDPNVAVDTNGTTTDGVISILTNLNGDTGRYTCEIPGTDQQLSITVSTGKRIYNKSTLKCFFRNWNPQHIIFLTFLKIAFVYIIYSITVQYSFFIYSLFK